MREGSFKLMIGPSIKEVVTMYDLGLVQDIYLSISISSINCLVHKYSSKTQSSIFS